MLSENEQMKINRDQADFSLLAEPRHIRIRFRKVGDLQYISHLDLQRTMHRILTRSGIPVWYTKGFNPHIKLVFSTPLSIGVQSECEMLDIRIEREMSCEEIKDRLNRQVTHELQILDVYEPPTKFSDYVWAAYEAEIGAESLSAQTADRMKSILSAPVCMAKKTTKTGEKEFDLIPQIRSFEARYDEKTETIKLQMILNVSNENYLNPLLLLELLCEQCQIDRQKEESFWESVVRTEAFCEDATTPFR